MIKVELSYNPYLLETRVKFNGKDPKINSLVQKYQEGKLQNWISKIPSILYDEMNGYDFDLQFSGTRTDFEHLVQTFRDIKIDIEIVEKVVEEARISDVRLIFRKEIEDSRTKSKAIDNLLNWLSETPNRKFDMKEFYDNHTQLFNNTYTYLLINATTEDTTYFDVHNVTIENAVNISEIPQDLSNTPILFYIDENNKTSFTEILNYVDSRSNAKRNQLFFLIHPDLKSSQIERFIHDKGIESPQIVTAVDDEIIRKYFEIYPIADYVGEAIKVLRYEINQLAERLSHENELARIENEGIHEKIDYLDDAIRDMKVSKDQLEHREGLEIPLKLMLAKNALKNNVSDWKKRKNKFSSDEEAKLGLQEFIDYLEKSLNRFLVEATSVFIQEIDDIDKKLADCYKLANTYDSYNPGLVKTHDFSVYTIPQLKNKLLENRNSRMVANDDLSARMFKILGNKTKDDLVEEISYSLKTWRDLASPELMKVANQVNSDIITALDVFYNDTAKCYLHHLETIIEVKTSEKNETTALLSEDEKKLNEDNTWLSIFEDKVKEIEERID